MTERITGIIDRLADADNYEEVAWLLNAPVENIALSVVDDTMRENAEFQYNAGLPAKVVRTAEPTSTRTTTRKTKKGVKTITYKVPCKWCKELAKTYTYPNVPKDVWRRHLMCECTIEYTPAGGGRVDTLRGRGKAWEQIDPEVLAERKAFVGVDTSPRQITNLEIGLGKENYETMQAMVDRAESDTAKKAWQKWHDKIVVSENNAKQAYENFGGIHVNIKGDAKGTMYRKPYSVTFHESGHAIDELASVTHGNGGRFISYSYKEQKLEKAVKEDVKALIDKKAVLVKEALAKQDAQALYDLGVNGGTFQYDGWKYRKAYSYSALTKDIREIPVNEQSAISDVIEGATRGKSSGSFGHGNYYWTQNKDALSTETFANFTEATFANPEAVARIKEYLPTAYDVYLEILESISG